jgi:ribosome assembly protein YihI (activator of Der GTPase)
MTRIKKTRSEKTIGAAKKPLLKQSERLKDNTKKKGKGRPSGAKANIDGVKVKKTRSSNGSAALLDDHRVGSKKAIELVPQTNAKNLQPKVVVKKVKAEPELSIEQQLAQIENDVRLNKLLDAIDEGSEILDKDQAYIEHQTAKHQKLMSLLDSDDDAEEDNETEDKKEAWEQIDSSEFDEYKS